jgi:hypothetical protein
MTSNEADNPEGIVNESSPAGMPAAGKAAGAPICERIKGWNGAASREHLLDFFDELCQTYVSAEPVQRSEIRKAVAANECIRDSLFHDPGARVGFGPYLDEIGRRAEADNDYTAFLRSALLVISLTDGFGDSRETLLWLADLWRAMEEKGIDPTRHYREIGEISSKEIVHFIGGPTKGMILQMLDKAHRDALKWP